MSMSEDEFDRPVQKQIKVGRKIVKLGDHILVTFEEGPWNKSKTNHGTRFATIVSIKSGSLWPFSVDFTDNTGGMIGCNDYIVFLSRKTKKKRLNFLKLLYP